MWVAWWQISPCRRLYASPHRFHPEAGLAVAALGERPRSRAAAQRLRDEPCSAPGARKHVGCVPGEESPHSVIYWQDENGTWLFATLDDLQGSEAPPQAALSELVNALHYSLGIPVAGTYLMGIVSLLYGVALFSGLVIHLPRLAQDLFALRPGRNLKRFWQDAHNVVGVLSLPVHLMFAVTGALLCLMLVVMLALNPLIYRGGLMAALPRSWTRHRSARPLVKSRYPASFRCGTRVRSKSRCNKARRLSSLPT